MAASIVLGLMAAYSAVACRRPARAEDSLGPPHRDLPRHGHGWRPDSARADRRRAEPLLHAVPLRPPGSRLSLGTAGNLAHGRRGHAWCWVCTASVQLHALFASPDLHVVALRLVYTGIGGLLIGYIAEMERIQRYRAWSVSRILGRMRAEAGLVAAVQSVLDELVAQFRASHGGTRSRRGGQRPRVAVAGRAARDESRRAIIRLKQEPRGGNADLPVSGSARRGRVQGASAGGGRAGRAREGRRDRRLGCAQP